MRSFSPKVASMVKTDFFTALDPGITLTLRKIIRPECRRYPGYRIPPLELKSAKIHVCIFLHS